MSRKEIGLLTVNGNQRGPTNREKEKKKKGIYFSTLCPLMTFFVYTLLTDPRGPSSSVLLHWYDGRGRCVWGP